MNSLQTAPIRPQKKLRHMEPIWFRIYSSTSTEPCMMYLCSLQNALIKNLISFRLCIRVKAVGYVSIFQVEMIYMKI